MPSQINSSNLDIQFRLNDEPVKAVVRSDMTLLRFLRDCLNLTGTKNGCSTGHCGACTVIVNGKAERACLVKMGKLEGARVDTIEGLERNGRLHPIQQAFIDTGAVQCGFCTPGMILSAKALLDANPHPSAEQIKSHLTVNKNLCRCTGYIKIIEAVRLAAKRMADPSHTPLNLNKPEAVEHSLRTPEALRMVTGTTVFGDDIHEEGMLHGKILWSSHPHAEILAIDTSAAQAVEGVVCVITARDIPGKNQAGIIIRDQPAIANEKVRYIGDSLAAVFAISPEIAREAVEKIRVNYRLLPGVFTPEEAARPGAPLVHEKGNLLHHAEILRGDVDEAFSRCEIIVEGDFTTPAIEHGFLEPESGIAYPAADGGVVLKIGTQTAFDDRTQLSEIMNLPEEKIRVIQIPMGGAFGAKEDLILQQYLALGALKTGRMVKMTLSRAESLRVHVKRHPAWMHYKTGADRSGKLLAIQAHITLDTGCYCSLGLDILENVVVFGAGPYYVPNLKIDGKSWYTNNVPSGAMRGFGVNQVAVALEQQIDQIALALGIDPFEIRLINGLDVGLPTASDHIMTEGVVSIKQTVAAARDAFHAVDLPAAAEGKKIGWGVASAVKNIGYGHAIHESAGAVLELDKSGNVIVKTSQHEYGQGAQAALVGLVMSELDIPAEKITYIGPDTALTPVTGPTTASRQTFLSGNAVIAACKALKDELACRAAEVIECDPGRIRLVGDLLVDRDSGKSVEIARIGEKFTIEKTYVPPESMQMQPVGEASRLGLPDFTTRPTHWCYAYNTQVAVVEVDTNTGAVKVLKIISANDVGHALNYDAIVGQIQGGVVMGLGFALSEQFIVENGINRTDTLLKCRLPSADVVPKIIPVIVEVPHPLGPHGAKGFAEAPSLATAPAILNAVSRAVGIRIYNLPANPERVKAALNNKLI